MATPNSIEEYLAALPEEQRAALAKLRKTISAAAPKATEKISYAMPAFEQDGRFLVSYAAFKDHCSFYPASALGGRRRLGTRFRRARRIELGVRQSPPATLLPAAAPRTAAPPVAVATPPLVLTGCAGVALHCAGRSS